MDSFAVWVLQEKDKQTAPMRKLVLNRDQACESRKKIHVHQSPIKTILIREKMLYTVLNSL